VNRLKIQRLESRRKIRDIYKVVGCLMPYRLCALTSTQLKLSSIRFMQHTIFLAPTAYQAGYQAHPPSPLPKDTTNAFPLWMESRVDCFLCRWKRSPGGSGEGKKTTIKCEDCNEALCFTPKCNCFYEVHHMWSIFIYSGGIWLDCGCVMCILKTGPSWGGARWMREGRVSDLRVCTVSHFA